MTPATSWQPAGWPAQVQLHMGRPLGGDSSEVPTLALPAGFDLVRATAAQATELAAVLGGNQELGDWDTERALGLFDEDGDALVDPCLLVLTGGQAVATAQLDLHRRGNYAGLAEMGWVAVLPNIRGLRLGASVSQAVLLEAEKRGQRQVFLRTDEWRLPAIVSYLRLDFRPWLVEPAACARWQSVLSQLDAATRAIGDAGLKGPWAPNGPGWDSVDWDALAGKARLDHMEQRTSGQDTGS